MLSELYLKSLVLHVFAYALSVKQNALIVPSILGISVYPQMKRHTLFQDNQYSHFLLTTLYESAVQYDCVQKSVRQLFPSGLIELKGLTLSFRIFRPSSTRSVRYLRYIPPDFPVPKP